MTMGYFLLFDNFNATLVANRSLEVLERVMKDAKLVSVLKEEQIKLQHPLPLETYLFKPVQRILKYHLLLKVS
jgi:RhoGEF domain